MAKIVADLKQVSSGWCLNLADGQQIGDNLLRLAEELAALGVGPGRPVIISLNEVELIDSRAVRFLVEVRQHVSRQGATIRVRQVNDHTRRIFEIMQLTEGLGVEDEA